MAHHRVHLRKRSLSLHQKQIRLLTVLSVVVGLLFAAAVLWLVNR
jgi:hypothetical protein